MTAMKKNWTYDEVQALIQSVRKNPSLYDRRDPDYNQTRTKEDIWKIIATTSAISDKNAEECKKKWKTLRIQQRRIIIKKIKKNERRSAIQWNCYDALKFLIPHMDWTAADDIKKEPDLDLSVLSEIGCDDEEPEECEESYENDEHCESQSDDSSYTSSPIFQQETAHAQVETAAAQADSTNIPRSDEQCTITNTPMLTTTITNDTTKLNQYLLTYLSTPNASNPIQIRNDPDGSSMMTAATTNCISISNQVQTANAPTTIYAEPSQSTNPTSIENKYQMNNRIITVPVTTAPAIVNYFLMDVAVQMERLNDIAQMEMKIEIHRLLLEKLRNINNLRQTPSICFTAPPNSN